MPTVHRDLIFDIGSHRGEDAAFYLEKGFRVVAVEAMPNLARAAEVRLKSSAESGQLVVINAAIADRDEPVDFYTNENSVWGTTSERWRDRNERLGHPTLGTIVTPGVTCAGLLEAHGIPYYMKIDIEGADVLCLKALQSFEEKCPYVSIESDKTSWRGLKAEFELLEELGYRRFKVIPQHRVHTQISPYPAREGIYVEHRFARGESGLFGEETPGRWLTRRAALARYRLIFFRYAVLGDTGMLSRSGLRVLKRLLERLGVGPGWYDTHAGR
jgi:FkbM family methyltransferase